MFRDFIGLLRECVELLREQKGREERMALSLANLTAQMAQLKSNVDVLAGLVSADNPGIAQSDIDEQTAAAAAADTDAQTAILAAGGTPATGPNPTPAQS